MMNVNDYVEQMTNGLALLINNDNDPAVKFIDAKYDAEFGKGWWAFAHSYDRWGVLFVLIPN